MRGRADLGEAAELLAPEVGLDGLGETDDARQLVALQPHRVEDPRLGEARSLYHISTPFIRDYRQKLEADL